MIEKTVIEWLKTEISDVGIFGERPEEKPASYILILKTGGGKQNHINTATIAVQSYAPSMYQAAQLNETVKAAMERIILLDEISRCQLNSDYNFTNNETKEYRYQAVFNLIYFD